MFSFLTIITLMLLKLLTLPQDIKMTYLLLIILTSIKYHTELQLNNANSFDTEAPFSELDMSITNGIVSSKIYEK